MPKRFSPFQLTGRTQTERATQEGDTPCPPLLPPSKSELKREKNRRAVAIMD
jgi:hypothetical protein